MMKLTNLGDVFFFFWGIFLKKYADYSLILWSKLISLFEIWKKIDLTWHRPPNSNTNTIWRSPAGTGTKRRYRYLRDSVFEQISRFYTKCFFFFFSIVLREIRGWYRDLRDKNVIFFKRVWPVPIPARQKYFQYF